MYMRVYNILLLEVNIISTEILYFKLKDSGNSHIGINVTTKNHCPHCSSIIKPSIVYLSEYDDKLKLPVVILYQCPACKKFFPSEHKPIEFSHSISAYNSSPVTYTYKKMVDYDLPEELEEVSPMFKDIYIQSLTAEADNLHQISGIGYRKSIEFLIKDFLINYQNEDHSKISKLPLSQAIDKLETTKVKNIAKASVWLGNDETHYLRKYEDKDVNDMKRFIRALAYFISSEIVANDAEEFITQ